MPPAYRNKPGRNQACVTLTDYSTGARKEYALGPANSPESRERYHRLIAQWEAAGRRLPGGGGGALTVSHLILAYWRAEAEAMSESPRNNAKVTLRLLRQTCGPALAAEFGPRALKQVRQRMIAEKNWSRRNINDQVRKIVEVWRWAVAEELLPAANLEALRALKGLRKGKDGAREPAPVAPAPTELVEATLPYLSAPVRALVELQQRTGARPSELLRLRQIDIDQSGEVWKIKLAEHKNTWRGRERIIYLGLQAQATLQPFFRRSPQAYLFSPREASERSNGNEGDCYTAASYRRAIARACARAFPPPVVLSEQGQAEWRRKHTWSPYQLRHRAATEIRRQFGLEAAQLMLGHSSAMLTDAVYAERDESKILEIVREVG